MKFNIISKKKVNSFQSKRVNFTKKIDLNFLKETDLFINCSSLGSNLNKSISQKVH